MNLSMLGIESLEEEMAVLVLAIYCVAGFLFCHGESSKADAIAELPGNLNEAETQRLHTHLFRANFWNWVMLTCLWGLAAVYWFPPTLGCWILYHAFALDVANNPRVYAYPRRLHHQ